MIEVVPNADQIKSAEEKSENLGVLNNSIRKGDGNVFGFLGEILMADHWGVDLANTYDYDLIVKNYKVDVKTKSCTSKPKPEYFCTVADYNPYQKCDIYCFVRILEDFKAAWLLGYCSKEYFFNNAKFYKMGDLDPSSHLGWKFKADCYNLPIQELKELKQKVS
jgi:hypothetical protein